MPVALWRVSGIGVKRAAAPARILRFHGTPRAQAKELGRQLRYLANRFEVVSLERLVERSRSGAIAITFDDGLRSNVEVAYPILARLGLPATFFVCPALIDERRWLWTHEARARLRRLGADAATTEGVVERMKGMDLGTRRAVEERLRDETEDWRPCAEEHEAHDLAGWDELARLDPALVAIGSHTLTHPVLTTLTEAEAQREVCGSRALLEKRLGRPVELFCYPNGAVSSAALELARRTYRAAVTAAPGAVAPGCDPLLLPRLAAPRGLLRLAWRLHP
ncbi:MAG: polysaccharide deacetylase family protein [Betaproteobacteria bacterium]